MVFIMIFKLVVVVFNGSVNGVFCSMGIELKEEFFGVCSVEEFLFFVCCLVSVGVLEVDMVIFFDCMLLFFWFIVVDVMMVCLSMYVIVVGDLVDDVI